MLGGFSKIFNPILDPIFGFLLNLDPFFSILIMTFIITLISTLIYKKLTDQEVLKTIKKEMSDIRKEMKEFKDDIKKMEELQKKSLEKSMIQFKQTMKPMFVTMIPILIIFGWFYSHLAYVPIYPNEEFTTTVIFDKAVDNKIKIIVPKEIELLSEEEQAVNHEKQDGLIFDKDVYYSTWKLKGSEGEYFLTYDYNNQEYTKDVLITNKRSYKTPIEAVSKSDIKEIRIDNQEVKVFGLRWFWAYFIMAIIFNSLLRKLLKVH